MLVSGPDRWAWFKEVVNVVSVVGLLGYMPIAVSPPSPWRGWWGGFSASAFRDLIGVLSGSITTLFVGLDADDRVRMPAAFTKNCGQLLGGRRSHEVPPELMAKSARIAVRLTPFYRARTGDRQLYLRVPNAVRRYLQLPESGGS